MIQKAVNFKSKRCEQHGTFRARANEGCPHPDHAKQPDPSESKVDAPGETKTADEIVQAAVLDPLDEPAVLGAGSGISEIPTAPESTDFPATESADEDPAK